MSAIPSTKSRELRADLGDLVISLFWLALMFGAVPFVLLWAVGTLSGEPIPLTFRTWVAAIALTTLVRYRRHS